MTMNLDPIFELADARDVEAAHMLITFEGDDPELADAIHRAGGVDFITDSVIEDLIEELDQNHDGCDHDRNYCELLDFDDEGTM
jgi:hypothetical protein